MGVYNEILEGGLNNVVVKRLGMQTGSAVPAVQPELAVDLTLESDRIEWGWLKGEYRFGAGSTTAVPAAGEHAYIGLQNPANSQNLVVVERVFSNSNSRLGTTDTNPPVGVGLTARRVDTRSPLAGSAAVSAGAIPLANLPTIVDLMLANTEFTHEYVITPGNWLVVAHQVAATAIQVSIRWRERPVLSGELG